MENRQRRSRGTLRSGAGSSPDAGRRRRGRSARRLAATLLCLAIAPGPLQAATSPSARPTGPSALHPRAVHDSTATQEAPILGTWTGTLEIPRAGASLQIVFHVTRSERGDFRATMDSPDQGATGIAVSGVEIRGDSVRFDVAGVGGSFIGAKTGDDVVEGVWRQSGMELPLTLERGDESSGPGRPQEPEPPLPYRSEEVRFENPEGGFELVGTLTVPEGSGPFPAVLLVSGSGPQDRDETVFGHRPFLVLSDHLSRAGVAVLRTDDRGVGDSGGSFAGSTTEDFVRDALAGTEFLAGRPDIDPASVGIVGHSEGALVAPMAADRSDRVSCLVLLAAPGLPGDELLPLQTRAIMRAAGAADAEIRGALESQARLFEIVRTGSDLEKIRREVRAHLEQQVADMSEAERERAGVTSENREPWIRAQVEQVGSAWFRYFLRHDPAAVLERVQVPVLALFGGLDLQVPPAENLPAVREALERSGSSDVTVRELPGLNHLFQPAETGSPTEYARIETTMDPRALREIAGWIPDHCGPGSGSS